MPLYDYRCTACQTTWEDKRLIAERDAPLTEPCPICQKNDGQIERFLPSSFGLNYTAQKLRPSDGFNDLLKKMKSKHRGSTINTR